MKLIQAPKGLLSAGASLFLVVPLSVVTAGVFSRHVWWDLPMKELAWVGWASLVVMAPLVWRMMMGRRGAFESVAVVLGLGCLFLVLSSLALRGTLQGVWTLTVMASLLLLMAWVRIELRRPYFDPRMGWFAGLPRAIANLEAVVMANPKSAEPAVRLKVARVGPEGVFVFTSAELQELSPVLEMELSFHGRKVRVSGDVVRQFYHPGAGCGFGVRFGQCSPDLKKDLGDFISSIRSEGYAI